MTCLTPTIISSKGFSSNRAAFVGRQPAIWHNDHSRPETPKIRSLEDEISRVVRAQVVIQNGSPV